MLISLNLKRFLLTLAAIFFFIAIAITIHAAQANKQFRESQLQRINSDDPGDVVDVFIYALRIDDLDLAKELIIPEQRERLEKWVTISHHKPFDCPPDWRLGFGVLVEPYAGGSSGYGTIENNMTRVGSSFFCYNNNSYLGIENAIVIYNGAQWKINDWDKICESPADYDAPRICYP